MKHVNYHIQIPMNGLTYSSAKMISMSGVFGLTLRSWVQTTKYSKKMIIYKINFAWEHKSGQLYGCWYHSRKDRQSFCVMQKKSYAKWGSHFEMKWRSQPTGFFYPIILTSRNNHQLLGMCVLVIIANIYDGQMAKCCLLGVKIRQIIAS